MHADRRGTAATAGSDSAGMSIAVGKAILAGSGRSLDDVLEAELAARLTDSETLREGRVTFLHRRPPRFTGR